MRRVQELLASVMSCNVDSLPDALTPFKEIEGWDSLKHVMLVVGLEGTFQVSLSADDIQKMESLVDVCRVLEERGIHE